MKPLGLNDNVALLAVLKCAAEPSVHGGSHHSSSSASLSNLPDSQARVSERRLAPKMVVGNTHLLFNPRRGDIKVWCILDHGVILLLLVH